MSVDKMEERTQELLGACLKGNVAAQRGLYELYRSKWYMLSMRYAKSKFEADDLLQEGLVYIFKDLHMYNPEKGKFVNWSARVLVNASLRYLKKNSWHSQLTDIDDAYEAESTQETVYQKLAARELTLLLQQLPAGYRLIFNMYAIEGYSHKEISELVGISVGTSKSQLSKARKTLRMKLEKQLVNI